jgi:hypothetical protein
VGPSVTRFTWLEKKKNMVCKVERVFILGKHGPKSPPHYEGNEIWNRHIWRIASNEPASPPSSPCSHLLFSPLRHFCLLLIGFMCYVARLNHLMDDHHFSYITKLKEKQKKQKNTCMEALLTYFSKTHP